MKKEVFLIGIILLFVIGCTLESPEQQPVSDKIQEQVPELVQEKSSDLVEEQVPDTVQESYSVVNEIIPEKVMKEEDSFEDAKCTRTFSPELSTGAHYSGPLFDAHFHIPDLIDLSKVMGHGKTQADHGSDSIADPVLRKEVILDKILCNFDKESVKGVIGFVTGAEQVLEETLEIAEFMKEKSSGKISLFLLPAMFSTGGLESIEKSNKGLFKGYGEMTFYDQDYANTPPDSPVVMETYKVAEKHNLIVMIHPGRNQKSDIENVLQKNPNVNFLLHGFEIENDIVDLMDKYPNVYFSIDSAVLYAMQGLFMIGPKEKFISRFKQDYNSILNSKVKKWKPAIEKHPDRFMWGSDRGVVWHYDEEISVLFEEFARAFIARLDPKVQEKFAYKNAEELIAKAS